MLTDQELTEVFHAAFRDDCRSVVERIIAREHAERLAAEVEWLTTARANAEARGVYSAQYLEGFRHATGWVRLHAEMAQRTFLKKSEPTT